MELTKNDAPERTIGQLVADATHDLSDIVRHEVALAKAELKDDVVKAAFGIGMFAAAAVLAVVAFVLLCIAGAYGLVAAGLPTWAAFLVVTGVLLVIAAALGLVGRSRLGGIAPPERTIATTKATVSAAKGQSVRTG